MFLPITSILCSRYPFWPRTRSHFQSLAAHAHNNSENHEWPLAQRRSGPHLLKETHARCLSHRCSGYPVGPLRTFPQAGSNVWGPQQSRAQASAGALGRKQGPMENEEGSMKEKQQLATRTRSMTPCTCSLCVCAHICVCTVN